MPAENCLFPCSFVSSYMVLISAITVLIVSVFFKFAIYGLSTAAAD